MSPKFSVESEYKPMNGPANTLQTSHQLIERLESSTDDFLENLQAQPQSHTMQHFENTQALLDRRQVELGNLSLHSAIADQTLQATSDLWTSANQVILLLLSPLLLFFNSTI